MAALAVSSYSLVFLSLSHMLPYTYLCNHMTAPVFFWLGSELLRPMPNTMLPMVGSYGYTLCKMDFEQALMFLRLHAFSTFCVSAILHSGANLHLQVSKYHFWIFLGGPFDIRIRFYTNKTETDFPPKGCTENAIGKVYRLISPAISGFMLFMTVQ